MSDSIASLSQEMRRQGVLYEAMQEDVNQILEIVRSMLPAVRKIPRMEANIADIKTEIKAIKTALRATNEDVQDHEQRITALETGN